MYTKRLVPILYVSVVVALLAAGCVVATPAPLPAVEQPKEEAAATEAPEEAPAEKIFLDVGQQPPITILINDSPWFGGFEKLVELYEEQTGNEVNLDVTPYAGMLEKSRNAVRDQESPYDLINIDTQNTVEFYAGGFLTPFTDIDPSFEFDPAVLRYGDSMYWNEEKQWRTSDGGKIMAFSPNGNVQLFFYRGDLYEEAGLEPPETWDDVFNACQTIQNRPELYGMVVRGERGNGIRFNWMPYMLGHGASIVRDPANGDFTVTINSPEAKEALDLFIRLANECGPPNSGEIGQSDMIQLLVTGKALQAIVVTAAWPNMDDPDKSIVVGKIQTTVIPKPADGEHATAIGNWNMGIPSNLPDERKQAALAFVRWFLTYDAQYAYAEFGSLPVRSDVYESDLADREEFRWMTAYLNSMPYAHQVLGYKEGAQVEEVLGLRLNQALVGELSSAEALNMAAEEIYQIFQESGRNTGMLEPLPE
ncbi:MAG: ABC transporter substrate-binding protein [Anaerolineae bacterium]